LHSSGQALGPDCDGRRGAVEALTAALALDSRAMDRRLARRNLRTALITAVIALLMFALTFVAALLYVA
jgi:predicted secreted protein